MAGLCTECVARHQASLGAPIAVGETLSQAFRLPLKCPRASLFFVAMALAPGLLSFASLLFLSGVVTIKDESRVAGCSPLA